MGIGMIVQKCMWMTGNPTFDFLLCQVWHSQGLYWTWVLLSVWNIVYISIERFIKINYPFRHRHLPVKKVCRGFTVIYTVGFLCLIPEYLQVKYDEVEGKCFADFYYCGQGFERFMFGYSIVWFLMSYAIPIVTSTAMYIKTILSIQKRKETLAKQNRDSWAASQIYEKDSKHITRTVVAVAIVFVISLSWETWLYLLSRKAIGKYHKNDVFQKVGVFLATFNSCINPFIYCVFLKCFRKSLRKTFLLHNEDEHAEAKNDELSMPMSKSDEGVDE